MVPQHGVHVRRVGAARARAAAGNPPRVDGASSALSGHSPGRHVRGALAAVPRGAAGAASPGCGWQDIDAIDAHYLYPDGVAAVWLGQQLGLPTVITARGSDVTLIPRYAVPRRLIQGALRDAAALIAVSAALKAALVELGAPPDKGDRAAQRGGHGDVPPARAIGTPHAKPLGLTRPTLISVGLLIERKGHGRTIEAMRQLPGIRPADRRRGPRTRGAVRPDQAAPSCRTVSGCWVRVRTRNSPRFMAPPMRWSWPHRAKAGPMSCWRRWPAAHPPSPATSPAIRRWCSARKRD